jgi:hydrogenase maturation factor HypF (carbamoyltransferase family)
MMACPRCGQRSRVVQTLAGDEGASVNRHRYCEHCGHKFYSIEIQRAYYQRVSASDAQAILKWWESARRFGEPAVKPPQLCKRAGVLLPPEFYPDTAR